jgi:APA family basic amino acid/polyamine antiporter
LPERLDAKLLKGYHPALAPVCETLSLAHTSSTLKEGIHLLPADLLPGRKDRQLLRILGVSFGLAVAIGNTVGAGILKAPGEVATQLPNVWMFLSVWVAGGLYALLGSISIAELATMLPRSGGQYVYAQRALGNYAGFVVGWSDWVSTCGSTAAVAIVVGDYTGVLVPTLAGRATSIAVIMTVAFALLQWRGVRWGSGTQKLTTLLKTLAFVALIAACFALGSGGSFIEPHTPQAAAGSSLPVALIIALQAVIFTYDGWTGVIYFSEEVRRPARDIPRALFGGVLSVIAIYLLVNVALLYVLPLSDMANQELAAGVAAQRIFGARGDRVIRIITIVSMLSSINAFHLMATRVLFAMSRDDLFTSRALRVNEGGTPTTSLFISMMVAVLFILSGTFKTVIAVLTFFFVASYAISFTSLFVLRRREPDAPRPFRAWGYPWTTGLALVGSVAFLIGAVASDWQNSKHALLLLAASYPAFILLKRIARNRPVTDDES